MRKMELRLNGIKVLQCKRLVYKMSKDKQIQRVVKDYEFDLYVNESSDETRVMEIDGQSYVISKNTLVCRKPGQYVCSSGNFNCYMLTIDFSGVVNCRQEEYRRHRDGDFQLYRDDFLDELPSVFQPRNGQEMIRIMQKLISVSYPNPQNMDAQSALLAEFCHLLAADVLYHKRTLVQKQKDVIIESRNYMQENFKDHITLELLAENAHMSKAYFSRLFREQMGCSPIEYLLRIRFDSARLLLVETECSVKEIASLCGYDDDSFFIAMFKKRYGQTPSCYREKR